MGWVDNHPNTFPVSPYPQPRLITPGPEPLDGAFFVLGNVNFASKAAVLSNRGSSGVLLESNLSPIILPHSRVRSGELQFGLIASGANAPLKVWSACHCTHFSKFLETKSISESRLPIETYIFWQNMSTSDFSDFRKNWLPELIGVRPDIYEGSRLKTMPLFWHQPPKKKRGVN